MYWSRHAYNGTLAESPKKGGNPRQISYWNLKFSKKKKIFWNKNLDFFSASYPVEAVSNQLYTILLDRRIRVKQKSEIEK